MGGAVSLGYDAESRRLVVNDGGAWSSPSPASSHGQCRTRLGKLAALACLAPNIVTAIVGGRQPALLTARTLQDIDLPLGWADQRLCSVLPEPKSQHRHCSQDFRGRDGGLLARLCCLEPLRLGLQSRSPPARKRPELRQFWRLIGEVPPEGESFRTVWCVGQSGANGSGLPHSLPAGYFAGKSTRISPSDPILRS